MHVNTLANIESNKAKPRYRNLRSLQLVLEKNGVHFRGSSGVEMVEELLNIHRFSGPNFLQFLTDDIVATIKGRKDSVKTIVHDESLFRTAEWQQNRRYFEHLQKTKFRDFMLVPEGTQKFLGKPTYYRFLPRSAVGQACWLVYGDRFATINWGLHEAVILQNEIISKSYGQLYDYLWASAKPVARK